MIEKLTPEQEAQIDVYYQQYLKLGLNTDRIDRPAALEYIKKVYQDAGFEPPKEVLFFKSPMACLRHIVGNPKKLTDEHKKKMQEELGKNYTWGSLSAYWIGFFSYIIEQLPVEIDPKLEERFVNFRTFSINSFWWFPYKDICLISEKPTEVHMENGVLHRDGGPAMTFSDGLASVWALRGVRVPQKIAETPADELDPSLLAKIRNVEVRRELIHKVGAERLISKLPHELLDRVEYVPGQKAATLSALTEQIMKTGGYLDPNEPDLVAAVKAKCEPVLYELYRINLGEEVSGTALKMVNPSTGDTHVEWVDDSCSTVKEANVWRRGGIEDEPAILT